VDKLHTHTLSSILQSR